MTLDEFVSLSAALTGYAADVLKPDFDTQQVSEQLYAELSKADNNIPAAQLDELTTVWVSIASTPPGDMEKTVNEKIMQNTAIARLAQNIIYMWFLGIWYDLAKDPNSFNSPNNDHVVSPIVYKNGLVWGEMGAHPMGFSTGQFGYWQTAPALPSLS